MKVYFQPAVDRLSDAIKDETTFDNFNDLINYITLLAREKGFVKIAYYGFDRIHRGTTFIIVCSGLIIDKTIGYCYFKNLEDQKLCC